jgi:hypothetical protein
VGRCEEGGFGSAIGCDFDCTCACGVAGEVECSTISGRDFAVSEKLAGTLGILLGICGALTFLLLLWAAGKWIELESDQASKEFRTTREQNALLADGDDAGEHADGGRMKRRKR